MTADTTPAAVAEAKVLATPAALELIARLQARYGPLMFHQSAGCCDGSAPICLKLGELMVGDNDLLLGTIGGCPFYISADQYARWQHPQLIVDARPGRGLFAGGAAGHAFPHARAGVRGGRTGRGRGARPPWPLDNGTTGTQRRARRPLSPGPSLRGHKR